EHEQAGNRALQMVVDPQATHRVVNGRVDAHWNFVWVFAGDFFVHLKKVAVLFGDHFTSGAIDLLLAGTLCNAAPTVTHDCVSEVEIHRLAGFSDTTAF